MRKLRWTTGAAVVAALTLTAPAFGADEPQRYTLDGQPAAAATALDPANICVAAAAADGTQACFSSRSELGQAGSTALDEGKLPPGYTVLPSGVSQEQLAQSFDRLAGDDGETAPAVDAPIVARDGTSCGNPYTWIYTAANFGGTQGSQGATGVNAWLNYSGTYDNQVSSFWNETSVWTARWHDYANGQGAYYGNGTPCRYVENLGNASMTDGGTANDRFSSFGDW